MIRISLFAALLISSAFVRPPAATAQDFTMNGGTMTSPFLGPAALQVFGPGVTDFERQQLQLNGFSPFHKFYTAEEGAGPKFVNSSCGGCHIENGRGPFKFENGPVSRAGTMVVKVAPKKPVNKLLTPVIQNHSPHGEVFHDIRVRWKTTKGKYRSGERFSIKRPILSFNVDGLTARKLHYSVRMTPPVIGVGLIEAIDSATIEALADPFDLNGDGISGRPNYVTDIRKQTSAIGRFGFKASQPTVEQQSAAALGNEMGMSNSLFPVSKEIEISDETLDSITIYQQLGGVPAARSQSAPDIERGKKLFFDIGCENCHTATITTGTHELPELSNQTIHPFSDFLLHDMGPGLADKVIEGNAVGREWRTTPLWGIGFARYLSRSKPRYLHDGRAGTIDEAILWHGGEAKPARNKFAKLSKLERRDLIKFLNSL